MESTIPKEVEKTKKIKGKTGRKRKSNPQKSKHVDKVHRKGTSSPCISCNPVKRAVFDVPVPRVVKKNGGQQCGIQPIPQPAAC
jgi:hypothetical protein